MERLGGQGYKHVHLLRVPCDRCLAIFIFRVPLENSHYAVSDNAARDSGFELVPFPLEIWPQGLLGFWQSLRPLRAIAHCPETFCDPVPYLVERVQCRVQGGISGEYGDTIFVENGMESNYGVWI